MIVFDLLLQITFFKIIKMTNKIVFNNKEQILVIIKVIDEFDLNFVPDICFKELLSDHLLKLRKKLLMAHLSWFKGPKKLHLVKVILL